MTSKCCAFNQTTIPLGTRVQEVLLPDLCTKVSIECNIKKAKADLEMVIEDSCPKKPGASLWDTTKIINIFLVQMNVIFNSSSVLTSPGFPSSYPANIEQCWMRTPSCGHHVQLEFTDFNVSFGFL